MTAQLGCFAEGDDRQNASGAASIAEESTQGGSEFSTTHADVTTEGGVADGSTTHASQATSSTSESGGESTSLVGGEDAASTSETSGSTGQQVLSVDELQPGDLVITEVMWNPRCIGDSCEWIEILNHAASPINILDLYVQDATQLIANQGRVTVDVIIEPGDFAVIARGVDPWPYPFAADAAYGPNPGFNNGRPDRVVLMSSRTLLDETASLPLDVEEGISWSLSSDTSDAVSNDDASRWCFATVELPIDGALEYGTPGVTNGPCVDEA